MVEPLPGLGSGDLQGGQVLHQVVPGDTADVLLPALGVGDADPDVGAQTFEGPRRRHLGDQVGLVVDVGDDVELIVPGEGRHGRLDEVGVRHPAAVVTEGELELLVLDDLGRLLLAPLGCAWPG